MKEGKLPLELLVVVDGMIVWLKPRHVPLLLSSCSRYNESLYLRESNGPLRPKVVIGKVDHQALAVVILLALQRTETPKRSNDAVHRFEKNAFMERNESMENRWGVKTQILGMIRGRKSPEDLR